MTIRAQQSRPFRNIATRNLMPDAYLYVNVRARASWCSSLLCVGLTSASVCAWVLSLLSAIFWSRLLGFYTPDLCVCLFSSHSFWTSSSLDVPAGVTQEEGHTGFLIHLLSAVRVSVFLARRIQLFFSLVDREVEFCVLTIKSFSTRRAFFFFFF